MKLRKADKIRFIAERYFAYKQRYNNEWAFDLKGYVGAVNHRNGWCVNFRKVEKLLVLL